MMIRSVLAGGLILMSGISPTLGTEKSQGNAIVTASFRNGVDGYSGTIDSESGQVPPNAVVHQAKLLVSAFDQGSTVNLHRMLVPFDESVTWSSLISEVSADGLEATRHKDAFTFGKIAANSSEIAFDVTDTVQLWVGTDPATISGSSLPDGSPPGRSRCSICDRHLWCLGYAFVSRSWY